MAYEHITQRQVLFSETDMAGIVHFANYFRYMEAAEHAFYRSLGYSVHGETEGVVYGWPRVDTRCRFFAPLRFEQDFRIRLLVKAIRPKALCFLFQFTTADSDAANIAIGELTAVHVNFDARLGRMVGAPMPESLSRQIEPAPIDIVAPIEALLNQSPNKPQPTAPEPA